jgi:hypothetical protein
VVTVALALAVGLAIWVLQFERPTPAPPGQHASRSTSDPSTGTPGTADSRDAPAQAAAAVGDLWSGDLAKRRAAVAPPLSEHLPTLASGASTVRVSLSGWQVQGSFAGADAVVHTAEGPIHLMVGFRSVDGIWRITFAQRVP